MIDPDIKQRMEELPRQYRDFIYSGFATEAANILGTAEDLSPEQVKIFESLILLYLLFFIDKNDISEILTSEGISAKGAAGLVFALEKSLPDFAKQTEKITFEVESIDNLATEISETEREIASLNTIRTMSHDMAAIRPGSDVVYQSSQTDILGAPTPVATPPSPQPPRWETDTKQ